VAVFGVGTPEVLVLLAVVVGLVAVAVRKDGWIRVDDRKVVAADAAGLEAPVRRLLASTPGSELLDSGTGSFTLLVRRRPLWMALVILLTLPFGLLFLLVKDVAAVQVSLVPVGGHTEVRIVGRTSRQVLRVLDDALAPAPAREVSVR
jgi:hypothetical protein